MANAVILAEPQAPFLLRWFEEYRWFRSNGRDEYWGEHAVTVPGQLALRHLEEVHVLDYHAFHWPLWTDAHCDWIFVPGQPPISLEASYANHLCESGAWRHLRGLTPGQVHAVDTNFHRWARPFVAELPDDYGVPGLSERAATLAARMVGKARRRILAPALSALRREGRERTPVGQRPPGVPGR